ncbi:MAG TPA: hypothetical protein VMU33_20095 [Burkholderiaceae bacterium]|nr:hypothetical protein [Burkholderiaceae bacterium]
MELANQEVVREAETAIDERTTSVQPAAPKAAIAELSSLELAWVGGGGGIVSLH